MKNSNRPIISWLYLGCFLIFVMTAIGGLTRLTHSGLSMVEWNLFMGSVPPIGEVEWQTTFDKYKQYPEYQQVNFNFSLNEFKSIFYWEYAHRMFGRLIGLVFIVPFFFFLWRKKISKDLLPKLLLILFLGGFQGFLGWYMVKSGLVKNPDVSHYRLAAHLFTAFITFAYTLWVALNLKTKSTQSVKGLNWQINSLIVALLLQIVWGAYVAGLNAGMVYNTWPLMGDSLVSEAVGALSPWWKNFVLGIAGVQFVHRYLAYVVVALVLVVFFKARKQMLDKLQLSAIRFLLLAVLLQFFLGVLTLLFSVPISLGLLHQLGAFILLGTVVNVKHKLS